MKKPVCDLEDKYIWNLFIDYYKKFKRQPNFQPSIDNFFTGEWYIMYDKFMNPRYKCYIHTNGTCSIFTAENENLSEYYFTYISNYNNCIISGFNTKLSKKLADLLKSTNQKEPLNKYEK